MMCSKILVCLGRRGDSVLAKDKAPDTISAREVKGCKSGNLREKSASD